MRRFWPRHDRNRRPSRATLLGDDLNATNDSWEQLPADLRRAAEAQLAAGESPLAWFELDLDTRLHYARGLLVLTPSSVAGHRAAGGDRRRRAAARREPTALRSWPLDATSGLRAKDQNSAGRLELLGPERPVVPLALHDRPFAAGPSAGRPFPASSRRRAVGRRRDRRGPDDGLPELRGDSGRRPDQLPGLRIGRATSRPSVRSIGWRALPSRTSGWFCWGSC